jgi:hypothetical protein
MHKNISPNFGDNPLRRGNYSLQNGNTLMSICETEEGMRFASMHAAMFMAYPAFIGVITGMLLTFNVKMLIPKITILNEKN